MFEIYMVDGAPYEVSPDRLNDFLTKFPNATKVDEPGKTSDSTMTSPSLGSSIMGSSLEGGSSEQPEISPWQNFKNNISNAFEMVGDVPEFYGIGTGNKSVEEVADEGDLGAYSGLSIVSTLMYESVFGKDKVKEMAMKNPGFWANFASSDSEKFQKVIENFEIEKKDQKRTMTFKEADSFGDYLSVIGGSIANVGGSVAYNLGTFGTGFFMDFASDNFITANKEKAKANNTTLEELVKSGEHDVSAPLAIGAFQAGLEYFGFSKIVGKTGAGRTLNKKVGEFLTKNYKKSKNIRTGLDILGTGRVEAFTEMGQTGLEIYNKELAIAKGKGEDINDLMSITKGMFSEQGIESGLQGFFGGSGLKAGSYSAKALSNIRKSEKNLDVEADLSKLVELKKVYNSSTDDDVRFALDKEIKKTEASIKNKVKKGNDIYNSLSDGDIKKIEKLSELSDVTAFRANSLIEKFKNGEIKEDDFNVAIEGLSNTYKENKQNILEILYKENIEFAKTEGKKIGKKLVEIESIEDFQKKYEEVRTDGDFEGDITGNDGFIKGDNIYINKQVALKEGAISVGSHELLHGIIGKSFDKLSTKDKTKLGKSFIGFLNKEQEAAVRKRLKDNYQLEGDAIFGTEEIFTAFSDAINKKEIKFNESVFQKIGLAIQELMNKLIPGYRKEFSNGRQAYDFLKEYQTNIEKGKLGERAIAFAKVDSDAAKGKFSRSGAVDAVNKIEQGLTKKLKEQGKEYTQDEFRASEEFNELFDSITESGKAVNNYIKSLGMSKEKTAKVIQNVSDRLMNYNPQAKRKTGSKEAITIGEQIMSSAMFGKLDAARDLAIEGKKEGKTLRIDAAKRTKEGETTFDIEDTSVDADMEAFEEENLSPAAQAKKAKADKQRYSEYRQKLGFETGSKIYNEVLDNVKKSLMMAYGATQNITDAQLRAKAIAAKLKKEYTNLNSPLFKQIKNFLTYGVADVFVKKGTKDIYFTQLKKFREDIVKNISTADLVQMERNTPDADKIFVNFVKTLTSIEQVRDAVNKEKLPPEALNKITKDKKTGKGSFSPSLYDKIMPTPDQLVGWADQPIKKQAVNKKTGELMFDENNNPIMVRSGLKGTRKDGIAMRMVNGLVTDAIMEARQSEEVQNKIAEMDIDPGSVAELGAAIGREVNVKFSKSNATGDISAAIDGAGDVNVYSQIKFSKSHREAYEKQLTKRRPDLTEEQRKNAVQSVFDFVDGKEIPNNKKSKYEKMAMHYTANGHLILPEDGYKVIEAERLAAKNKVDPFSVKDPNVLMQAYVEDSKSKKTDPDKVKTFSNKTEYSDGVVIYDVKDSKQGQLDVRKVADTHFGPKFNNWCLVSRQEELGMEETIDGRENAITFRDGLIDEGYVIHDFSKVEDYGPGEYYRIEFTPKQKGELGQAWQHWKQYNEQGNGHKIAFHNGKLLAFRDGNEMSWWDINDNPTDAPVVRGKKDKDGFKPVSLVYKNKSEVIHQEKVTGNKKNGTTIRKDLDGNLVFQETKKNGKTDGLNIEVDNKNKNSNNYNFKRTQNFKEGQRLDFKEERNYTIPIATENVSFGKDEIRVNNITKYERSFTEDNWVLQTETITIEGTVKQKYFEGFKDPGKLRGFEKANITWLTPAWERYYGIQGKKVKIVKTTKQVGKTEEVTVTIDGVVQEPTVKFSKSDVKFSLTKLEVDRKLGPYLAKQLKDATSLEQQAFWSGIQELTGKGVPVAEAYNTVAQKVKNQYGVEVVGIKQLDDNVKNYYLPKIREAAKEFSVDWYKDQLKEVKGDIKAQLDIINDYIINVGRPIRSGMVYNITSNEKLMNDVYKQFGNKYKAYYELVPTNNGKKVMFRTKERGELQNINLYQDVTAIKSNPKQYWNKIDEQSVKARKWLNKLLDSKQSDGIKKSIIQLTSYGQRSPIRKLSKAGVFVEGLPISKTTLEHEITVNDIHGAIIDYIDNKQDKSSRAKLNELLDKAYVHVLPNRIDNILKAAGKTSNRDGKGYESVTEAMDFLEKLNQDKKLKGNTDLFKFSKSVNFQTINNAVQFSRSANNPTKGITVLDFDDTLATTKSMIRFTRPDGTKGKLNAEQYASTYQELSELGYKWDFSEFNKVVDGKTAPLFEKAMKLQGKFGPKNMFVLTARPAESAPAIRAFLKANGLNIPLKNITGLANSTAEAKALWIADKVGEGYNDFYFADDALQNVQAVENILEQLNVKRKVQRAVTVKFSKSGMSELTDSKEYKSFRNKIKNRKIYHGGTKNLTDPKIKDKDFVTWFYVNDKQGSSEAQTMAELWGINAQNSSGIYESSTDLLENQLIVPDMNDVPAFHTWVQENYPDIVLTKFKGFDGKLYESVDIIAILNHKDKFKILKDWIAWTTDKKNAADIQDVTGENLYDDNGNISNIWPVIVIGKFNKNNITKIKLSEEGKQEIKNLELDGVKVKFSKSSLRGNKAVKNMLDQFDVKSKVQQARVKFSKSMNDQFNDILENITGIESIKRFSIIKGRKRGDNKGKFRVFIPPSHEDFVGLLYNFMGKGREGDKHRDFFEQALVRPLNRAYREIDTAKQAIANDYKSLNEKFFGVKDKLVKSTPDGDFTFQDAIRVYLWDKHGHKIPGLSETDQRKLAELVMSDPQLQAYAETLNVISKQENYVAPGQAWETANIRIDLVDATGRVGRAEYFAEFNENADVLFSEENLNKIEAGYGRPLREALEDMLHRIKTGVNRPKGASGKPNMFMNWLNASVSGVMFFNTRSALLQQMSNVNFLNFADNNILAAGKAFANQPQYWKDFAMIFNSDMLKQRRGGIGTDINGAELAEAIKKARPDSIFDQVSIIVGKALKLGFLPTQIGDNIAIATGGAAFYRNRVNTYIKDGMSVKEAEAKAFTDLQNITQSTQQSARPDMTSKQQASWIGKLVLNFLNTPSQYNRIIKKAGSDIKNRRITPPNTTQMQSDMSNMSRILYYGAAQNLIFYSLQTALFAVMFGDDEEDNEAFLTKKERVIQGSIDTILRGSGIYGVAVSTLKNMAIKFLEQREKGYNKDESAVIMEMLNFSPVVGIKARKIVNAEKTLNYNKKVIDEMETFDIDNPQWSAVTNYVEAITTAPANRLYQKTINLRNASDDQYTALQRLMFFSGYTTWSLNLGDTKKMEKIKQDIKDKKKKSKKRKSIIGKSIIGKRL